MVGLVGFSVYLYCALGPSIVIAHFNINPALYGTLSLIPFATYALGNLMTRQLNKKLAVSTAIIVGSILILIVGAFFVAALFVGMTIVLFYFFTSFVFFVLPIVWSNASLLATNTLSDKANANAVLSFINILGTVIGLTIVCVSKQFSSLDEMVYLLFIAGICMFLLCITNHRRFMSPTHRGK